MSDTSHLRQQQMLSTALGPSIMQLLFDNDVIEIMLNPDGYLWVEKFSCGKIKLNDYFNSEQALNIIKLIAAAHYAIVDQDHPELACELKESGARFQGFLPPITSSACFTIRKPAIRILSLEEYVIAENMSEEQKYIIKKAILDKKNILIAGGTGSGKTTLANALLHELSESNERIIILEDLPELKVHAPDVVKLRSSENKTMRELLRGVLRMRPDRIIMGEVRDGAALELLKAWNTGHPGGLCTLHANSAASALLRLEDLIREVIPAVPQRLLEEALDLVIYIEGYRVRDLYWVK